MNAVCSLLFSLVRFVVSKMDLTVAVSCGANLLVVKFGSFVWVSFSNHPALLGAGDQVDTDSDRQAPNPVGVILS